MLKVLITKIEIDDTQKNYYAIAEGDIPDRFFKCLDPRSDLATLKVFPFAAEKGYEIWLTDSDAEEVELLAEENFREFIPENSRWFAELKNPEKIHKVLKKRRLKNSNRQISDRPKTAKTFKIDTDLLEKLQSVAAEKGISQISILETALKQHFSL